MILLGATAIEDKLQDDVPDTIATLAEVTQECVTALLAPPPLWLGDEPFNVSPTLGKYPSKRSYNDSVFISPVAKKSLPD